MTKKTKESIPIHKVDNLEDNLNHSDDKKLSDTEPPTKQEENIYIHKDKSTEEFYNIIGPRHGNLKYHLSCLKEEEYYMRGPEKSLTESQLSEILRPLHNELGEEIPMRPLLALDLDGCLISDSVRFLGWDFNFFLG